MFLVFTLLGATIVIFVARHALKYTALGFCLRHGISQENLYVSLPSNAGLGETPTVYERRIRRANLHGTTSLSKFEIPLDIEEFRRVSANESTRYTAVISGWFPNTHECRKDDRYTHEPLFDFRRLTVAEQQSLWPRLLHETVQYERQLTAL